MTNMEVSHRIISQALELGVQTFCISPGGRNAPLVESLSALPDSIDCRFFFDERAASFFALGRARRDQAPVAVVTTSGTAVSEMLSAAVEAHYTGVPLLFISADRPQRFRNTGAPQAIEQVGIFGSYVEAVMDGDSENLDFPKWSKAQPMHWNIAFDEPLLDGAVLPLETGKTEAKSLPEKSLSRAPSAAFEKTVCSMKRPLLVIGSLRPDEASAVLKGAKNFPGPIYIEGTSGLREHPDLAAKVVTHGKRIQKSLKDGVIGSVIRIGGVPTARFWRDLETMKVPVVSLSETPFPGSTVSQHFQSGSSQWFDVLPASLGWDCSALLAEHRDLDKKFQKLLETHPKSEWGWFAKLSKAMSPKDRVYVGNSLPIRNWDLAADRSQILPVHASRGANGIDGQLATALGGAKSDGGHWAVLGDLTAIYDMSSMLLAPTNIDFNLVVVNNGGGQIFSKLFANPAFLNPQTLNFHDLSRSMGWDYIRGHEGFDQKRGRLLIEIVPEKSETQAIEKKYGDLCAL